MRLDDSLQTRDEDSVSVTEQTVDPFRAWPLVSVIVCTYHRSVKLRRALDSVFAQTFRDMEVWVIHDGEPDTDTLAVFEEYADKFEAVGIDFFPTASDEHSGYYCYPRNIATENSRGTYIANLDDDNEWFPTALADLVEGMEEGEQWPDLVYGRREYVCEDGATTTPEGDPLPVGGSPFVPTPWAEEAAILLAKSPKYNFIDASDFLVSKGAMYRLAVQTGKMWNEDLRRFGDYELIVRLAFFSDTQFKAIDKVIQRYYWHGENVQLTRPTAEAPRETRLE